MASEFDPRKFIGGTGILAVLFGPAIFGVFFGTVAGVLFGFGLASAGALVMVRLKRAFKVGGEIRFGGVAGPAAILYVVLVGLGWIGGLIGGAG